MATYDFMRVNIEVGDDKAAMPFYVLKGLADGVRIEESETQEILYGRLDGGKMIIIVKEK